VIPYRGQDRLEPPADRCLLTRVIATLDDSAAVDLLGFAARSLTEGGRVDIIDFEADGSPAAAFGDLLHLARSGGAVHSRDEWDELARRAGLRIAGRRSVGGPYVHFSMELERGGDPRGARASRRGDRRMTTTDPSPPSTRAESPPTEPGGPFSERALSGAPNPLERIDHLFHHTSRRSGSACSGSRCCWLRACFGPRSPSRRSPPTRRR
jgi:O-methyltransferase domain